MLIQESPEGSCNLCQPNKTKPEVFQADQSCSPIQSPLPWLYWPPCSWLGSPCTHITHVIND